MYSAFGLQQAQIGGLLSDTHALPLAYSSCYFVLCVPTALRGSLIAYVPVNCETIESLVPMANIHHEGFTQNDK